MSWRRRQRLNGIPRTNCHITNGSFNCSKEAKNNSLCRYLAALCARGRIHSARMHFCASGHSHEDIDQFFSLLGTFLQSQSELHDPGQFLDAVRKYLSNRSVRPLERGRDVVKIDQVRSWTLMFELNIRMTRAIFLILVDSV